jgi:3-hydroxyisobutyrate dehydrogenase
MSVCGILLLMKNIAVIGVGIMGHGIAANFLKKGYVVHLWNRHKEKIQDLVEQGAIIYDTPREATAASEIVFEVTANDESSRTAWLGKDGILAGAGEKTVLIECATVSIDWIDELAKLTQEKKLSFFDMGMTGSRAGAESGKLTFLVGGDKDRLEELKPVLSAISTTIQHFGPVSSGMRYKLILNMLQAIHMVGFGEALRMAAQGGLDLKAVGDTLIQHPGGNPTNAAWRDYQHEPHPINFSVEWITKDLTYAKKFAKTLTTPLLDDVLKKYSEAVKGKWDQKDWTTITKLK